MAEKEKETRSLFAVSATGVKGKPNPDQVTTYIVAETIEAALAAVKAANDTTFAVQNVLRLNLPEGPDVIVVPTEAEAKAAVEQAEALRKADAKAKFLQVELDTANKEKARLATEKPAPVPMHAPAHPAEPIHEKAEPAHAPAKHPAGHK